MVTSKYHGIDSTGCDIDRGGSLGERSVLDLSHLIDGTKRVGRAMIWKENEESHSKRYRPEERTKYPVRRGAGWDTLLPLLH